MRSVGTIFVSSVERTLYILGMENKIMECLVRQLQDVQDGSNWLDENFKKKLTGISEYDAFIRPIPEVHSIAELVAHLLIWRSEGIKKLQGCYVRTKVI